MHPHQPPLPPGIEDEWRAALADAHIHAGEALIYPLDGSGSQAGLSARYLARGVLLRSEVDFPELSPLLEEMNGADSIGAHRIVIRTERTIEGIAALIRHELEHALQFATHGQPILDLQILAEAVLRERVGGLDGGGILYQAIPAEMDANAAAAVFVRSRFGAERINALLRDGDGDAAAFRSLVGPPPLEMLPERMIQFLATVSDLCEKWAHQQGGAFRALLDTYWRGAGEIWERLVNDDGLKLPR